MEVVSFNTKEKITNGYGMRPTLFYDVEGRLAAKDGKNIKIEKMIEDKKVSYSLKLKEDISSQLGDMVKINKENIVSMQVEEKKKEEFKPKEDIIKRLDLEDDEETKSAIEHLSKNKIPITKENIESFSMSNKYLKQIIQNIDFDSCVKLVDMKIDLEEDSLQKIANALSDVKEKDGNLSLKELLKLDRKLNYKEAEEIAKDIYGRTMGRDIYDSIIALHKEKLPITKENIDRIMEVMDKLNHLKEYEGEILVKVFKEELPVNIESLYKYKLSYNNEDLNKNIFSSVYEKFTIEKEESIEELSGLLKEIDVVRNQENIRLLREFVFNGVEATKQNFDKIFNMKSNIKELTDLLDREAGVKLMDLGIDPLKEEIGELIDRIKDQASNQEIVDANKSMAKTEELEALKTITDRELLSLIKEGKDFKIENLKQIKGTNVQMLGETNERIVEKTITISNIFNTLGELKSDTIAFAVKRNINISLHSLYDAELALDTGGVEVVEKVDQAEENLILQEYQRAKSNIRLSLIEESIKDGIGLENLPLEELNEYIDKKINRYKEVQNLIDRTRQLKGREESIIPKVMRNDINMSINQLSDINSLLNQGYGIGNLIENIFNGQNMDNYKGVKDEIQTLETKIKDFSLSLKEGKENTKENYKNLLGSFEDLSNSFNSDQSNEDENMDRMEEYLKLQNQLSKEELMLQIPVLGEDGYKNINLIVPDIEKGIDKDNMAFYFNLETENLGQVKFNLEVKENGISIDFEAGNDKAILKNKEILEAGLDKIGYVLKKIEIESEI